MKDEVLEIKKTSVLGFVKYFIYLALFLLLFNVKVMGIYKPCFYGLFVVLALLNENIFCLSLAYLSALCIVDASTYNIIFGIICCLTSGLCAYICTKKQKKPSYLIAVICGVVIALPYLYFGLQNISTIYIKIINVLLNILFMICSLNFLNITRARKFNLNLNVDEIICGCLMLMLLFCGFQNINIIAFDIVKLLGFLIVIFGSILLPSGFNVILGVVAGLGAYLCSGNLA